MSFLRPSSPKWRYLPCTAVGAALEKTPKKNQSLPGINSGKRGTGILIIWIDPMRNCFPPLAANSGSRRFFHSRCFLCFFLLRQKKEGWLLISGLPAADHGRPDTLRYRDLSLRRNGHGCPLEAEKEKILNLPGNSQGDYFFESRARA